MRTRLLVTVCFGLLYVLTAGGCVFYGCIREGELVEVPGGQTAIEALKPGDLVVTADGVGSVTAVAAHRAHDLNRLVLDDGRSLDTTTEHPIATSEGWVRAGSIRVGQTVRTRNGTAAVRSTTRLHISDRVYDLTVSPGETFYAAGILVHNKQYARPPTMESFVGDWLAIRYDGAYRLTLRADGTGTLISAYTFGGRAEILRTEARVTRWKLRNPGKSFEAEGTIRYLNPRDGPAEQVFVASFGGALVVRMGNTARELTKELTFTHEAITIDAIRAVRSRSAERAPGSDQPDDR